MDQRGSRFLVLPPGSCPREVTEPPDGVWTIRTGWSWTLLPGKGSESPQDRNGLTNIRADQALDVQTEFPALQHGTVPEDELICT